MTFDTCRQLRVPLESVTMEPGIRKVSWRRRQALFLAEVACMVGLCGLGYINVAIALAVLTTVSMLHEDTKAGPCGR